MKKTEISVAVLCGGKSRRMGQDKAKLYIGETTFLEKIIGSFEQQEAVEEILLSVRKKEDYPEIDVPHIEDMEKDKGPLMGICSVMAASQSERMWVASCDMPLTDWEVAEYLLPYLTDGIDAVVPVDQTGRKYVLSAWYRTSAGKMIKEQLDTGEYKVQQILDKLSVCYVAVEGIPEGKRKFRNINTPGEYEKLKKDMKEKEIPIVSFVAYSGTGKTTFLERLIPVLKEKGLRIAVVKHDGHRFEIDHEGKDSDRFTKAGADVTGLISSEKAVLMENREVSPGEFLKRIRDVDLIITEGFKKEQWPKIMLHRKGTDKAMPLPPKECLAVITDEEVRDCEHVFALEDIDKVAEFLVQMYVGKMHVNGSYRQEER